MNKRNLTFGDLVLAVADQTDDESEVVATIVHMVNSGRIRFTGRLAGGRFLPEDALLADVAA